MPVGGNALEVERRELALDFVLEGEVKLRRLIGLAVAQDGLGFARIVIAVVAEEHDLAADLRLQPPRGLDFGDEKPPREKSAGLLAKTDDRGCAHAAAGAFRGRRAQAGSATPRLKHDAGGAADEVVPEIADARAPKTDGAGYEGACAADGRPEHRRAADALEKERHQKEAEHDAVEDRAEDVDGLDQVLREAGEERERDRDAAPERREPFARRGHCAPRRAAASGRKWRQKIDRRRRAERVELGGFRRQRRREHHRDQQADHAVRQLRQDEA